MAPVTTGTRKEAAAGYNPVSAPDYLPPLQMRQLQLKRLQAMVGRAYEHQELTRKRMDERGLKPADIRAMEDIRHLPFTVKTDLRDTYPFGLFAAPMEDIVRLHASSGTTGKPIVVAYTREDVQVWASAMMRAFACYGLHAGDIIQNAYGYGLFTGGLGAHYGGRGSRGAGRADLGRQHRPPDHAHARLQSDGHLLHAQLLHCIFSISALELKRQYSRSAAEGGRCSERNRGPRRCASGSRPRATWRRTTSYGLSEIIGPGVGDRSARATRNGLHVFEDHFYPEIIDPQT